MVFGTDPHIERAREHLDSGEIHRLRYAYLELRLALERIAYQKLQRRLDAISIAEFDGWQPKRVLDTLMELVDPDLDQDVELRMGTRPGGGDPGTDTFMPVGRTKGVNPKLLGKYWQKLGSFLHMEMPAKKRDRPKEPDGTRLAAFIAEVIAYIQETTATAFDMHFSKNVTFSCTVCSHKNVRNVRRLKDQTVVQCQNPQCNESFIAQAEGDHYWFRRHQFTLECKACGEKMEFIANELLDIPYDHARRVRCSCGVIHVVCWRLQYADEESLRGSDAAPDDADA